MKLDERIVRVDHLVLLDLFSFVMEMRSGGIVNFDRIPLHTIKYCTGYYEHDHFLK